MRKTSAVLYLISARGLGIVLQFVMQIVVGRLTGAYGVGLLQLCATWMSALGELNALGLPTHAMKTLAGSYERYTRHQIFLYLVRALTILLSFWCVMAVLFGAVFYFSGVDHISILFGEEGQSDRVFVVVAAFFAAVAYALMRLLADSLKALGRRNITVFVENAGAPLVLLLTCLVFYLSDGNITARNIVVVFCAGFVCVVLFLFFLLCRACGQSQSFLSTERTSTPRPCKEALPFWGTSILSILLINYPFFILPMFTTLDDIGVFAVAFKLTNTVTSVIVMLGAMFGPQFAAAGQRDDKKALLDLLMRSQVWSLAIYLPIIGGLVLFLEPITSLFGGDFAGATVFVFILAAGQLVNAGSGLPGVLLNMTGHGRAEFFINLSVLICAVIVSVQVGSEYGIIGVAVVYALTVCLKNVLSYTMALITLKVIKFAPIQTAMTPPSESAATEPSKV